MKNVKKVVCLSVVLVAVVLLLTACGSSSNKIEGTWNVKSISSGTGSEELQTMLNMGGNVSMTFKDGKVSMKMTYQGQSFEQELGSYKTDGDKITIDGTESKYKIDGKKLTITVDGVSMELERD